MAKKKLKDLLHTFAGPSSEEEPEALEEGQGEDAEPQAARPVQHSGSDGRLHALKGSLLQVWEKWAGHNMPPTLSLTEKLPADRIQLDRQQLEREIVRVTVQLEQDAKRRMREIAEAEEKGVSSLNAICRVYLSKDKMICWAFIFPPVGEEGTLPMEGIGRALQTAGVTTGIDTEAMLRALQDKPYFELFPIAIGTPVAEGEQGSVIEHFEREVPPEVKIDDNGMADYKHTSYVRQVNKDDVICSIVPPVEGKSGLRVDGTVVAPKPVRSARAPKGANTTITDDGLQLVAAIDGHLEFKNGLFQVRPVLVVDGDVDYTVGNIDFTGDVHVRGDVRENFQVTASGSISIDGLVEAATVEAGGDLVITRGVVGDNRALLRSRGSVRVKYLENCVVYAGKGVYADCIMNSQIFSDTVIAVTSGRGSVIGGALTAAQAIKAKMIGAQSGRRTELTLGVLPYVQNELHNIQSDIAAYRYEREDLDKSLAYLEREQGIEGSDARLAKARMRRSVLEMKEQQLLKRQQRLEPMTPDVTKCYLECDVVYPVTRLVVQGAIWMAKEIKRHCKVRYDARMEELEEVY